MTMYRITLPLSDVFDSSSLVTRSAASILIKKIEELNVKEVTLDFSEINHTSRSFFDELVSKTKCLKNQKILFKNLSRDLESLYHFVDNYQCNSSRFKKIDKSKKVVI